MCTNPKEDHEFVATLSFSVNRVVSPTEYPGERPPFITNWIIVISEELSVSQSLKLEDWSYAELLVISMEAP